MTYQDPRATPGNLAKHIPADVFNEMPRAEIVLPSAVVSAELAAQQHRNVVHVFTPDGREILVDVDAFVQHATETAVRQRRPLMPRWALTAAILMPVGAGSFTLAAWGLSLAVPAAVAFAEMLRQLFFAVLAIAVLVGVICFAGPKKETGETVTATATAVSRGFFSKAIATATAVRRKR
ncbi:hypothetical protein ACF1HU_35845 [Streptomyces olivaceus]|uniref:hypothetical protein n=1 Tax=Streptomyces olivaceus TaxID=47716 RepID=UPI003702B592